MSDTEDKKDAPKEDRGAESDEEDSRRRRRSRSRSPRSRSRSNSRDKDAKKKDDGGPGGEDVDGLSEKEVHVFLVDREKARIARDYGAADVIRDKLASHGITVDDRRRVWQGRDGKPGVRPSAYDEPRDWEKSARKNFVEPDVGSANRGANDWICPSCRCNNFASRDACFRCREPRGGRGGYGGGRGYDDRGGGGYDRGGYDDRRGGGYDRGGYDDRRGGGCDDRRGGGGGYDDRRGGYDDRRGGGGGYDDRRGGYDDRDRRY